MNKKTAVVIIRFRKDDVHHSNTDLNSLQNGTVAKENAELKMHCQWQLEAGRHDLANLKAIKQTRDLQGENQKLEDELNILKGTLRGVQDKHLHTVKLLEERTADWKAAQTFLTTVDRYAGAEIMKMVDDLNDEIFQGAGLVSELLGDGNAFEVDERRKNAQLTQGDRDNLTQFIGPKLLEHLSTTKWKQLQVDPFPLQLAVQAILTRWCVFMVDSFYPGPASNDLKEIYRRIWESGRRSCTNARTMYVITDILIPEPQAVAGRWRAMMAKQAKHLDSATRKDVVIKMLLNLLCLCGSPMANVASPSQQTSLCLHEVVSTISNMWMQLRTAIQEGVTTTEMKIFDANPNDIYQDEVMNDIYSDPKDVQQAEHILCAVGMGLHRSVIRRNGDGIMSIQRDITLKAKVAFPSVLFDSA
jgi:hypothetical protein